MIGPWAVLGLLIEGLLMLAAGLYLVVRLAAAIFKGEKILLPMCCVIVFWATFYMFLKAVARV